MYEKPTVVIVESAEALAERWRAKLMECQRQNAFMKKLLEGTCNYCKHYEEDCSTKTKDCWSMRFPWGGGDNNE